MKSLIARKPRPLNRRNLAGRFSLRITPKAEKRLHAMGRMEKRRISAFVRVTLDTALDSWEQKHPVKPAPAK